MVLLIILVCVAVMVFASVFVWALLAAGAIANRRGTRLHEEARRSVAVAECVRHRRRASCTGYGGVRRG
jgi:hypothetical protein